MSREINAGGHHFLYGGISGGGVHYWDNKDFSEQCLHLSLGYKNRSVTRSFGIVPFVGQNLLGGSRYNFVGGFNADFSQHLSERWRLTLNAGNMWKHYQEDRTAARYDSHMPLAGATLMYSAPKDWLLYGGADWSHDLTKERNRLPSARVCVSARSKRSTAAWVCGQTCAIHAGRLTRPGPLCTASRAKTTNIRQTCRFGTTKSLGRALRRNSISAI